MGSETRDHGGGLDAAIAQFGGQRKDWIDLSTGVNPTPYPLPRLPDYAWHNLPDQKAMDRLIQAARQFWNVPDTSDIIASSGVSQLIAILPTLSNSKAVRIDLPTYNEHEAAFANFGHSLSEHGKTRVIVHPNNPDGRLFSSAELGTQDDLLIIDESFCDVCPDLSHIATTGEENRIVLKGLGKFWGLAGLRLGFAIGQSSAIQKLRDLIGPWAVSGPALHIGALALEDQDWAKNTRNKLSSDAIRLDKILTTNSASLIGGTDLFRLYDVADAEKLRHRLASKYVWSRTFPYSKTWIRLGLPGAEPEWDRLAIALGAK